MAASRAQPAVLAGVLGLETLDLATVGATAGPLQRAMHITHAEVGLVASVSLLVAALATLPAGTLVDRVDRVRLLGASIVLWSAALVLVGTSQSFAMLLASRTLLGVVSATAWPSVASLIGDLFDADSRSRVWATVLSGELLGGGLGLLVAANLAAATSWRVAFLVLPVPGLATAAALLVLIRDPRRDGGGARDEIPLSRAVARVLGVRTNLVLIFSSVLGYFFFAGERMFGTEYLHGRYGLGTGTASLVLVGVSSGALAGVFGGASVADRLRRTGHPTARMVVPGIAFIAAAVLFVPGIASSWLPLAAVFLFGAALCLEAAKAPADAARLDVMPSHLWGRAEGVRTALRTGAQALAPLAFGALADSMGSGGGHASRTAHHAHGLQMALLLMLVPLALSGVVLLLGRRSYPRDARQAARSSSPRAILRSRVAGARSSSAASSSGVIRGMTSRAGIVGRTKLKTR